MKKKSTDSKQDLLLQNLGRLYGQMQKAYDNIAQKLSLSCSGCSDNCCTSYFQHHTYIEWAYLWKGLSLCPEPKKELILDRAREYLKKTRQFLDQGQRPRVMCPLNEEGWCSFYEYRLMICRLHGVPNMVTMPDGSQRRFPGCHLAQKLSSKMHKVPVLDRTKFYISLSQLESKFLGTKKGNMPKVNMTLAEMILQGPPTLKQGDNL